MIDHILRKLFAFSILWNFNVLVSAELNIPCPPVHPNGILYCAITDKKEPLNIRNDHKWESTRIKGVLKQNIQFDSGIYPEKPTDGFVQTEWTHDIDLFLPSDRRTSKVLLYVSGGTRITREGIENIQNSPEQLDFAKIASQNKAIVAVLNHVPNQYLFMDSMWKTEDGIIAYTYPKIIENPEKYGHVAAHIPMARAVIRAIDTLEEYFQTDLNSHLGSILLTGASKRAWAISLAALEDERIGMLMPIVLDIFNVKKSLGHIIDFYEGTPPPALGDYQQAQVIDNIDNPNFQTLMEIEDPISYLNGPYQEIYRKRFSLKKLFIQSSGDDFFVPDASHFYLDDLPGENQIRYLPNTMHYLIGSVLSERIGSIKTVQDMISNTFHFFIDDTKLPSVKFTETPQGFTVETDIQPSRVTRWTAVNPTHRDFRCLNSYQKNHLIMNYLKSFIVGSPCDQKYKRSTVNLKYPRQEPGFDSGYVFDVPLLPFDRGFQGSFVEVSFKIGKHPFIITSQVIVHDAQTD